MRRPSSPQGDERGRRPLAGADADRNVEQLVARDARAGEAVLPATRHRLARRSWRGDAPGVGPYAVHGQLLRRARLERGPGLGNRYRPAARPGRPDARDDALPRHGGNRRDGVASGGHRPSQVPRPHDPGVDDRGGRARHCRTTVLRRYGVRWPGNAYMHTPIFDIARGGAVLTGVGGDELFGTRGSPARARAARRSPAPSPRPRSPSPPRWRRRSSRPSPGDGGTRGQRLGSRPVGRDGARALAADAVAWPARWDGSLRHWLASRAFAALRTACRQSRSVRCGSGQARFWSTRRWPSWCASGWRDGIPEPEPALARWSATCYPPRYATGSQSGVRRARVRDRPPVRSPATGTARVLTQARSTSLPPRRTWLSDARLSDHPAPARRVAALSSSAPRSES